MYLMRKKIDESRYYRFIVQGVRVELTPVYDNTTMAQWFLELSLVSLPHLIGSPELPPTYKVSSSGGGEDGGGSSITEIPDPYPPRWYGRYLNIPNNDLDKEMVYKKFTVELGAGKTIVDISLNISYSGLEIEVTVR